MLLLAKGDVVGRSGVEDRETRKPTAWTSTPDYTERSAASCPRLQAAAAFPFHPSAVSSFSMGNFYLLLKGNFWMCKLL